MNRPQFDVRVQFPFQFNWNETVNTLLWNEKINTSPLIQNLTNWQKYYLKIIFRFMEKYPRWGTRTQCQRRSFSELRRFPEGDKGWSSVTPGATHSVVTRTSVTSSPPGHWGDQNLRWISPQGLTITMAEMGPGETYWDNLSWLYSAPLGLCRPHFVEVDSSFIFYSQTRGNFFNFWVKLNSKVGAATKNHLSIHFE